MKKRLGERAGRWIREFRGRIKADGAGGTWKWLYGHGVPAVMGIPIIKYHRIADGLYVGPQHGKLARRVLTGAGVTASVSLRLRYNDVERGLGFGEYCHLSTSDGSPPNQEQLREGVEFIRSVINGGGSVYVHCQTGLGRGPTMAAAYLISEGRSLDEACRMIRAVRPFTHITPPQMERLREFELESFGQGH